MGLCRTVVAACDEHSVASVVEVVDDSACDRGDKPLASRSAWRYCNLPNFADSAKRRVSLPVEVLENYLYRKTKFFALHNKIELKNLFFLFYSSLRVDVIAIYIKYFNLYPICS